MIEQIQVSMWSTAIGLAAAVGLSAAAHADGKNAADASARPHVEIVTSKGRIVVELHPDKTPKTVENFLRYVDEKFYDGTIFHRSIPNFMIQGGGFDPKLNKRPTHEPIDIEADKGLSNERGTIAMARTMQPNSASSQFFVNLVDNPHLDFRDKSIRGWGYTAFGRVVEGMDVVDKIAAVPTERQQQHQNVPKETILIKKARRVEAP